MRDRVPADAVGYVAVRLPELDAWQGFYVRRAYRSQAEKIVRDAGGVVRDPRGAVGVAEELPGADAADQAVLGALSALVVRLYSIAVTEPKRIPPPAMEDALGGAVHALHLTAGSPWLLVTGHPDRGGSSSIVTDVQRIEAASLDEARERIATAVARATDMRGLGSTFEAMLRRVDRGGT